MEGRNLIPTFIWVNSILILSLVLLSFFMKPIDNKKEFLKKYITIILTSVLLWFFWVLIFQWNINLLILIVISFLLIIIFTEKRFHHILKIIGTIFLVLIFVIFNCASFSTKSTLYLDNLTTINRTEFIEEFKYKNQTIVISSYKTDDKYNTHHYSCNIYDSFLNVFTYHLLIFLFPRLQLLK
jgi:hypothetical protein